jgi:3-hydroxymyristoyl/3-hydroxydecanoyl-(acyl carrier protein) dehydratase
MNFLFVDKILALEPGQSTTAIKNITLSDDYLRLNHQGEGIIIPCILGEAIGQLCSWNVIQSSDFQLRLIGGVVGEVNLRNEAFVGDTVILENTIDHLDLDNQVVSFHGTARVQDTIIIEVKNGLGPLLPIADFNDVQTVKNEYKNIYRPGPVPVYEVSPNHKPSIDRSFSLASDRLLNVDKILFKDPKKEWVTLKNLSLTAPYFADHFPKRPVLPLSLLLESNLQLGQQFLADMIDETSQMLTPIQVSRIKMSEFVEPGDSVVTKVTLKKHSGDEFVLAFRNEVNEKRVCIAEATYLVRKKC